MAAEGTNSGTDVISELLGSLLVVSKRRKRALDTAETHLSEALRLLAEAKGLLDMQKDLLEAYQGAKTERETIVDTKEDDATPF